MKKLPIVLVCLLVLVLRLSFVGKGANAFGDEFRYWYSAQCLLDLSQGEFAAALAQLFRANARPCLVLSNLPPVFIQSVVYKWVGLDPRSPDALLVPQWWNVAVSVAQLLLFYRLVRRWVGLGTVEAAGLVLVYGFFASSNFYLRHLLPYDFVLLCWFYLFDRASSTQNGWALGMLTGVVYLTYPGYWLLVPTLGAVWLHGQAGWRYAFGWAHIWLPLRFLAGVLAVVAFFEVLARLIGQSLLSESFRAGDEYLNYLQNYDGGLRLLADYLYTMEGGIGVLLGLLCVGFMVQRGRDCLRGQPLQVVDLVVLVLLLGLLFQSLAGYMSGLKVFYGRLFKMYLPFMALAGGWYWFHVIKMYLQRLWVGAAAVWAWRAATVVLLLLAMVQFGRFIRLYHSLGYPRDALYALGLSCQPNGSQRYDIWVDAPPDDGLQRFNEYRPAGNYATIPPGWYAPKPPTEAHKKLLFVNFTLLPCHLEGAFQPLQLPDSLVWQWRAPHFMSWEGYWFEENLSGKRAYFQGRTLMLGVAGPR